MALHRCPGAQVQGSPWTSMFWQLALWSKTMDSKNMVCPLNSQIVLGNRCFSECHHHVIIPKSGFPVLWASVKSGYSVWIYQRVDLPHFGY